MKLEIDINKISLYLSWKLPPYYWKDNLYSFVKSLRIFSPNEFTNEEIIFIKKLANDKNKRV